MLTKVRIGTKKEIESLADFLALNLYKDYLSGIHLESMKEAESLGMKNFIIKYSREYYNNIEKTTFIEEYYEGKIHIYRTNIVMHKKDNDDFLINYEQYYLDKNEFVCVTGNIDVIHKELLKENFITTKGKRNRPPNENSILKTLEILRIQSNEPHKTINSICKNVGLTKSTFFKTKKWLANKNLKEI